MLQPRADLIGMGRGVSVVGLPTSGWAGKQELRLLTVAPFDLSGVVLPTVGGTLVPLGFPAARDGDCETPNAHLVDAEGANVGSSRQLSPYEDGQGRQEEREDASEQESRATDSCDLCCPLGTQDASPLTRILPPVVGVCIACFWRKCGHSSAEDRPSVSGVGLL